MVYGCDMFTLHSDAEEFINTYQRTDLEQGWHPSLTTKATDLYEAYQAWTRSRGGRPCSLTAFGLTLARLGVRRIHTSGGNRYFLALVA